MKRPDFLEGALLALGLSLATGVLDTLLTALLPAPLILRLLIAAASLGYTLYLLYRSATPVGRVTTLVLWLGTALFAWMTDSPAIYLLIHTGMLWLVRSLYYHSSLISALLDLGLWALGLAAAVWAMLQSGSLGAAVWCLFLVQALFAVIPPTGAARGGHRPRGPTGGGRFNRALNDAETALRKISSSC